jgi:hypothetical protein
LKYFVDSARPPRYIAEFRNKAFKILEPARSLGQSVYGGPAIAEHLDASVHAVLQILRTESDTLCVPKRRTQRVAAKKQHRLFMQFKS